MNRKVFGISLPRTGTSSLAVAFRHLDFHTAHYLTEADYEYIHEYDFANDFPIPLRYKELDERFPNSKFIFTARPSESWLDSYELHLSRTKHISDGNWQDYNLSLFGTLDFDRKHFKNVYMKHWEDVLEYFKGRADDLLILDFPYRLKSWNDICDFVEVKLPDDVLEFPNKCGSYSISNPFCPDNEDRRTDEQWKRYNSPRKRRRA
jgi:hypothetical protein